MAEHGRVYGAQNLCRPLSPDARARATATLLATRYRHVPDGYLDLYKRLRSGKKHTAAEALAMVLEQQRTDEARRLSAMTPLERQLERVRNGARVVEKFRPPVVEHAFTLGGVAGEAL